ncbi:replication fork protection component Swi3-domain-containing protein [Lactifluus subvellereus]|nr:replication fork protection component Swi3-domain-containing protein [Lactifluus subvellereus]
MDINDIWDLPVETSIDHAPINTECSAAPSHASTRPLFLSSDDEEDAAAATAGPSANKNPDVDALFEGIDDIDDSFQELSPALDLDALRREADARNTRAVRAEINSSIPAAELAAAAKGKGGKSGPLEGMDGGGEDGEKKKRKPVPKLDEARLLGTNGFPQLVKDTKNFKPKGKGHEATDLDRVLQVYQFWTHKLYPKTRFKEMVDRVEKLCHSKRMQVSLSVWRDEAKGLVNGVHLPPADNDSDEDVADPDAPGSPRAGAASASTVAADDQGATSSSQPPSPTPSSRPRLRLRDSATSDSGGDSDASHPPLSSPDRDEAAIELDVLLEEEEALRASGGHSEPTSHAWKKSHTSNGDAAMDEDDDGLWGALGTGTDAPASAPTTAPAPPLTDEDEEMWDIVRELEQEQEKDAARPSNLAPETPAVVDAHVDDLDDLYL